MKRWNPIALYLFLVFVSGAVVGALGYRAYNPPSARSGSQNTRVSPEEWRRQYLDEMHARLGLSGDQLQKLNVILDGTDQKFRATRATHNQVIKQIREEQVTQVRAILDPGQLPKYEQLRAEREQRNKNAGKK